MNDSHMKPVLGNAEKSGLDSLLSTVTWTARGTHSPKTYGNRASWTEQASTLERLQRKPGERGAPDRTTAPPEQQHSPAPQSPGLIHPWVLVSSSLMACVLTTSILLFNETLTPFLLLFQSLSIPLTFPNFFPSHLLW